MHISEAFPTIVTTGSKEASSNTTVSTNPSDKGTVYRDADALYAELSDLVNEQFKAWYCHHFHRIGRERVFVLAAQARADGFNKRRLFSHLLKAA